jgi:predicted RNase H-like nuclease (RuvC/YqgF family)
MPRGNPDNLRAAAQRKREAAITRATAALEALERDGKPVTFRGLAKTAGVSVDFLYGSPLRARIEKLRSERESAPPAPRSVELSDTATQSNVVRALIAQIGDLKRRHRAETEHLQAALAAAQGENLELRRQLGRQGRTSAARPPSPPAAGASSNELASQHER